MYGVERFGVRLEAELQLWTRAGTSSSVSAEELLSDWRYEWSPKRTALRCSLGATLGRGARGVGIVYAICGVTGVVGVTGAEAMDAPSSSASANISSSQNSSYSPHEVRSSRRAETMLTPFGVMMPSPMGTSGSGCFANFGAFGSGDRIGRAGSSGAFTAFGSEALTRGRREDDRGYGARSRGGGRLRRSFRPEGRGGTGGSSQTALQNSNGSSASDRGVWMRADESEAEERDESHEGQRDEERSASFSSASETVKRPYS